jgi:hypothetical protein
LTADQLKYSVYNETKDLFVKSLELLYTGESEVCKENFRAYLEEKVLSRTIDTDNALKKFFKTLLLQFNSQYSALYLASNIANYSDMLIV